MASTIILSDNGASSGSAGLKQTAGNDGVLILQTTTSGGTPNSVLTMNNRGDIGVAITPSTWSTGKSIQFPNGAIGTYGTSDLEIGSNYYYSSPNYKYYANGYSDLLALYNNNFQIQSATSGTADANITYTQTLGVGLGTSLALQGATSQSGTGITFPASQNPSSNANTLDDYEEGTWTPTFAFGGGTTGITYSSQVGRYTRVGRLVTLQCYVALSNKGSSSGEVTIRNFPFNAASGSTNFCAVAVWGNSMTGLSGGLIGYVNPGSAFMYVYCSTTGSVQAINNTNFGNGTDWMINVSYIVD